MLSISCMQKNTTNTQLANDGTNWLKKAASSNLWKYLFCHHHDANLYCLNKLMETYARFWVHMHDVVTLDLKGKTTKGFIHTMMSTYQLWIFNIKVMKYNPSISLVIDIINFKFSLFTKINKFCRNDRQHGVS